MTKQIKIKETPPVVNEENFEVVKDELVIHQSRSIIENCEKWNTVIQVTEWINKTGFEIIQCNNNGGFQHMSITKEEANIINAAIIKLIKI